MVNIEYVEKTLFDFLDALGIKEPYKTRLIRSILRPVFLLCFGVSIFLIILIIFPGLRSYVPLGTEIEQEKNTIQTTTRVASTELDIISDSVGTNNITNSPCLNIGQNGGTNICNVAVATSSYEKRKYVWENKDSWVAVETGTDNGMYQTFLKFKVEDPNSIPPAKVCLGGTLKGVLAFSHAIYYKHITKNENGYWCALSPSEYLELNVYTKGKPIFMDPVLIGKY